MLAVEGDRAQHTGSCYKEWHQTWWRDNTKISVLWFSSLNCAVCFPGASQYWKGNTEIGRKAFLEFNSLKSRGCISRWIHMCYATNSFCDMWCFLNNLPVSLERSNLQVVITAKWTEKLRNNCVIITATHRFMESLKWPCPNTITNMEVFLTCSMSEGIYQLIVKAEIDGW